jgi:1,2-diacylglycerol 3-alpha-glucosyltransferase
VQLMRIALLSESYEPIVNGVSVSVGILRDELTKRGHEVFVFAPANPGYTDQCPRVVRVPSWRTRLMPDYPIPSPSAGPLRRALREIQPDVIHTQTPFILGMLGAKCAREQGVALVSTNHTLYTEYAHYVPVRPKSITRNILIRGMRWYYSKCDEVIVPSEPVRERLQSYGVSSPISVVKTGIMPQTEITPERRAELRAACGLANGDRMVLYVGRIAREKNLTMLLDAFDLLRHGEEAVKLVLIGGGPALAETQRYATELGLDGLVRFVGMVPSTEVGPYYRAADIFAFPSTTETQGLAIGEAMLAGLPVVAVDAGGVPENVSDGVDGYLTQNHAADFAYRLKKLVSDPADRERVGTNAAVSAQAFSAERMTAEVESIYQRVVEAKRLR